MTFTEPFLDEIDPNVLPFTAGAGSGVGRLQKAARERTRDDVSGELTEQQIAEIGQSVVDDWNRDKASNSDWREKAEKALDAAAQEKMEGKDYPWKMAANVRYPLLTIAGLQFASRAVPAIIKGDQAVKVKTFGKDAEGRKQARANRVAEFLNWVLFYKVDGWEADTDAMLHRLPAVGQHYRKVYWDPTERRPCIESVSALRLTIPADAPSLRASPRITHDFDRYPHEIGALMRAGAYRTVELLPEGEDSQASRVLLEQHRLIDLDGDGLPEPYVVTVDASTTSVLRIEEAFDEDDIDTDDAGQILGFRRWCPFVDYGFIPDPKGRAYSIGFGHLLTPIMDVVNTTINQMIDAGHAQVAGGGFISAELRLQGAGQNGVLRFQPSEYKTVNATGAELRNAIYERTFPAPSPILFQLLDLLLGSAKDIASVNDSITGDAARTAPVGTTLALIEQSQQVFNAIYKRIFRALREEFKLLAECVAKYGDPQEYARFCDVEPDPQMGHNGGPPMGGPEGLIPPQMAQPEPIDPIAAFQADMNAEDLDIQPVSDPSAVTRMQQIAKAQFVLGLLGTGQLNPREAVKSALEAGGIDDIDKLLAPQAGPDPVQLQMMALQAEEHEAKTGKLKAGAQLDLARAASIAHESTGAQADAKLAKTHAEAQDALTRAAERAAGLLDETVEPEPFV